MPLSKSDVAVLTAGAAAIAIAVAAQFDTAKVDDAPDKPTGAFVGKEPAYPCPWQPPGLPPVQCADDGTPTLPKDSWLDAGCAAQICNRTVLAKSGRRVYWKQDAGGLSSADLKAEAAAATADVAPVDAPVEAAPAEVIKP